MFGNMEPDQVRSMALSAVGFGVIEAAKEFPAAQEYGDEVIAFLREGGSLEFKLDPPEPITRAFTEANPDPEPEQIIEFLGMTLEHNAP